MSFSHMDYLPVSVGTFTFATIKQFLQEKMKKIIMTLIAVVTFSSSSARADAWPVVNHTIQAEGTPIVLIFVLIQQRAISVYPKRQY